MRAYGYLRVSTEGQAEDGVSLDAQRAKVQAWCDLNGYDLADCFVDAGLSGGRADNRPGLQQALSLCGHDSALIVYSLSRLARSTADTLAIATRLEKQGADLVSLSEKIDTTTASGKMVFRMLAVLAEFERDQVSERTTMALKYKQSKGERTGSVPYGWTLDTDGIHLIPNMDEQAVILQAQALRAEEWPLRAIGEELGRKGYTNRAGKLAWNPKTVQALMTAKLAG